MVAAGKRLGTGAASQDMDFGGRLFFLFLEALRGKPVDQEKEAMIHTAGMALLLAFMVFILFNDVRKLF